MLGLGGLDLQANGPKRPARLQAAGLLLPLLYFLKIENKSRKKRRRKEGRNRILGKGIIFPHSQKYARSKKNRKGHD